MRKLTLQVETLKVDSFQTHGVSQEGGTVHGRQSTIYLPSCATYCYQCPGTEQSGGCSGAYTCHNHTACIQTQ